MARPNAPLLTWLEKRWVAPAYAGGVLLSLALAFFAAAINSMAGWLYAISGVMLALAAISMWLPPRSLKGLQIQREPIRPISVGEPLTVVVNLENVTSRPKVLIQAQDDVPSSFQEAPASAIAVISARQTYTWTYTCRPTRRGLYHWPTLTLRTAAPFGLFWCQRSPRAPAHATIYPEILPLTHCPLIDQMGVSSGVRWQASRQSQNASEGITRAVRPYRWGDPTRLIHWRTSARYGELRVRELEELTADNQVLIGLDTSDRWSAAAFESAVIAAASLYVYSLKHQLGVALWLPHTGVLQNKHAVLAALAEVMPGQVAQNSRLPAQPMIWLTASETPPPALPAGSQWVRWLAEFSGQPANVLLPPALTISTSRSLLEQLQSNVREGRS